MTTQSLGSVQGRNVSLVKYVLQLEMVPLYIPSSMSGLTHYQPLSGGSFRKFARGGEAHSDSFRARGNESGVLRLFKGAAKSPPHQ